MRVWMDGVKEAVTYRGLTLEQIRVTVHDREDGEVWGIEREMWMSEWFGTEVQMQDFRVIYGV